MGAGAVGWCSGGPSWRGRHGGATRSRPTVRLPMSTGMVGHAGALARRDPVATSLAPRVGARVQCPRTEAPSHAHPDHPNSRTACSHPARARGLHAAFGDGHELVVGAPSADHSGAGVAVGPVYERESITSTWTSPANVHGSPARRLLCIEGFGPRPGSTIRPASTTGSTPWWSAMRWDGRRRRRAQFGVRGLAVSIAGRWSPHYSETAVGLACSSRAGTRPTPSRPPCSTSTSRRLYELKSARSVSTAMPSPASPSTAPAAPSLAMRGDGDDAETERCRALTPSPTLPSSRDGWASPDPAGRRA